MVFLYLVAVSATIVVASHDKLHNQPLLILILTSLTLTNSLIFIGGLITARTELKLIECELFGSSPLGGIGLAYFNQKVDWPLFQLGLPAIFFIIGSYLLRKQKDDKFNENILFVKAGFTEHGIMTNILFLY
ncbi:hypothetical protein BIY23_03400 [Wolbachia pipientis]|uniref:Uncharacterized protein n=1 Tax=Wolbachia pipientis TaxID=955 RepID=A0A1E7QJD2_WOLPI|nr:hypothetical protein [Wolbachia pipientis]OEY86578.1 hypothetical protein BIY23_03400 [Wolbachia pipientis]